MIQLKRILLIVALIFAFSAGSSFGDINSYEDIHHWMNNYYIKAAPEELESAVLYYTTSALFESQPESREHFAKFCAHVIKDDFDRLGKLFLSVEEKGNEGSKYIFMKIVWWMQGEQGKAYLEKIKLEWPVKLVQENIESLLKKGPENLYDELLSGEGDVDLLFSEYFVTGREAPIQRLINALDEPVEDDRLRIQISFKILSRFQEFFRRHKAMYEVALKYSSKAEGTAKVKIDSILVEFAEKYKKTP